MTSISVDLEDLEKLVYATSAIKGIEAAIATHNNDPMVKMQAPFTEAVDRMAREVRNAKRSKSGTLVSWDEPLTKTEIGALRYIALACADRKTGFDVFVLSIADKAAEGEAMSVYDKLAAKGCIEMGQFVQGIMWAGAAGPDLMADEKGYCARLTPRGKNKLDAATATATHS